VSRAWVPRSNDAEGASGARAAGTAAGSAAAEEVVVTAGAAAGRTRGVMWFVEVMSRLSRGFCPGFVNMMDLM
jgi:hypothetical protein